jgi:hypothetical protein
MNPNFSLDGADDEMFGPGTATQTTATTGESNNVTADQTGQSKNLQSFLSGKPKYKKFFGSLPFPSVQNTKKKRRTILFGSAVEKKQTYLRVSIDLFFRKRSEFCNN